MGWEVNATPRPLYPRERPGTQCVGGWVGPRVGLEVYSTTVHLAILCKSGQPARPRTQHDYHHDTKVKPEAATAVIELLMMGGKTPETC